MSLTWIATVFSSQPRVADRAYGGAGRLVEVACAEGERTEWPMGGSLTVTETASGLVLEAEFPGVRAEEVELEIEGDWLRLSTPCRAEAGAGRGVIARSFLLPPEIDPIRIRARQMQHVLAVELPFREASGAREVPVTG